MGTDIRDDRDRFTRLGHGVTELRALGYGVTGTGLQDWIKVFKLVS